MATIKISEEIAIAEHKPQYDEIKKKFPTGDIDFSYEYCVRIDNTEPDMSTKEKYVESVYSKWGVSLQGKQGKKRKDVFLKPVDNLNAVYIPSTIKEIFEKDYDEIVNEKNTEKNRETNLDSILKIVGKSGSCVNKRPKTPAVMNGSSLMQHLMSVSTATKPVYPTLDDLKQAFPNIYQKYQNLADGEKLVFFNPSYTDTDEWGFEINSYKYAYKPLLKTDNRVRIIIDEGDTLNGCILYDEIINATDNNVGYWISLQYSIITKIEAAQEGTNFKGWQGANEYRLTKNEIQNLVKGRIFTQHMEF